MMRWKVAGALVCMLSLLGCGNDVEAPSQESTQRVVIDTPRGKVVVQNPVQNFEEEYVIADIVHEGVRYKFRVAPMVNGAAEGGVAELLDESGALLFSIESWADNSTGETVFIQRTMDDYLAQTMYDNDERVREQYDANGDVAVFEYPSLPEDSRRRAANYYQHGLPAGRLPAEVAEFVGALSAFDSYYKPHSTSTLHDNPAGELLVSILTAPELEGLVDGPGAERWRVVENLCNFARACQALICYTNPSSLACFACTVVSVACSIVAIICSWFC